MNILIKVKCIAPPLWFGREIVLSGRRQENEDTVRHCSNSFWRDLSLVTVDPYAYLPQSPFVDIDCEYSVNDSSESGERCLEWFGHLGWRLARPGLIFTHSRMNEQNQISFFWFKRVSWRRWQGFNRRRTICIQVGMLLGVSGDDQSSLGPLRVVSSWPDLVSALQTWLFYVSLSQGLFINCVNTIAIKLDLLIRQCGVKSSHNQASAAAPSFLSTSWGVLTS